MTEWTDDIDLVLCAVGDTLINHDDPSSGFRPCAAILEQADIVFANCEGLYVDEPSKALLAADAANAAGLGVGNVSVMSVANNHAMDAGPNGLARSMAILDSHGIQTVGAGADLAAARAPVIVERRGVRVAFVAAVSSFPAGIEARGGRPGVNPLRFHNHYYLAEGDLEFNPGVMPEVLVIAWENDIAALRASIAQARAEADLVVFSPHWGEPVRPMVVQQFERETARVAVAAGADLVLCHHHHIIRGVDFDAGAPIFHGLGNFVFHTRGFGAIPPAVRAILDKQGGEYAPAFYEDYPMFPMHPDSRRTFIAVCGVRGGRVRRTGLIPAMVRPAGEVEPLRLDSPEGAEFTTYFERINREAGLGSVVLPSSDMQLGGYEALEIVATP